jgi:hypothetical protein
VYFVYFVVLSSLGAMIVSVAGGAFVIAPAARSSV